MKLYVCWGTFQIPGARSHPCRNAYLALKKAGYQPEVIKAHSFGALPGPLQTKNRKLVEHATGSRWVPALETDDGQWISDSKNIIAWAEQNAPTGGSGTSAA